MAKIYKDQTKLTFTVTMGEDLTNATSVLLKYIKPGGTEGLFTMSISDAASGVCTYTFADGNLDTSGFWTFWGFVTFSDGKTAAGESFEVQVHEQGY